MSDEAHIVLSTKDLGNYLGKQITILLSDAPFSAWDFDRSVDDDLDEPVVNFVFSDNGVDVVCDEDGSVRTIFLHFDDDRFFDVALGDIPSHSTRQSIADRFGPPAKSGSKSVDPILGRSGNWDRYDDTHYSLHVEFQWEEDRVELITLMRSDVVPR